VNCCALRSRQPQGGFDFPVMAPRGDPAALAIAIQM